MRTNYDDKLTVREPRNKQRLDMRLDGRLVAAQGMGLHRSGGVVHFHPQTPVAGIGQHTNLQQGNPTATTSVA